MPPMRLHLVIGVALLASCGSDRSGDDDGPGDDAPASDGDGSVVVDAPLAGGCGNGGLAVRFCAHSDTTFSGHGWPTWAADAAWRLFQSTP